MKSLICKRVLPLVVFALAVSPSVSFSAGPDNARARQRPIENFVNQQGTFCVQIPYGVGDCRLFTPPVPNILAWNVTRDDGIYVTARVDYAGVADGYLGGMLGTTTEGSITERPLPDGRAEVSVRLHTKNALVWVVGREILPSGLGPAFRLFGHTAQEVEAGDSPALADAEFRLVFINTAPGAPLPDLTQFWFDPTYTGVRTFELFHARGTGQLIDDLGGGQLVDGPPAEVVIQQVGLLEVHEKTGGGSADGWPAEIINLRQIGKVK